MNRAAASGEQLKFPPNFLGVYIKLKKQKFGGGKEKTKNKDGTKEVPSCRVRRNLQDFPHRQHYQKPKTSGIHV